MAEPSAGDMHVDAALTDFSRAYFADPAKLVWAKAAPLVPSPKQSNKYFVYNKDELLYIAAQKTAPNTEAPVRTYQLSTDTFFCDVYKIAVDVAEEQAANADPVLDPEQDAALLAVQDLNLTLERDFATAFFNTSIWGTDDTDENWANPASDPIGALTTGIRTILQNTGRKPNMLLLGANSWYDALANHPDIIDRIPTTQARIATPSFLGSILGVEVVVAESIRNTANEGLTGSYSFNLGAHALLAYVDPNPGPRTPTAMAAFNWTGLTGAANGIRVKRIDAPLRSSTRVQAEAAVDFKVVGSDLGYFFSAVTS